MRRFVKRRFIKRRFEDARDDSEEDSHLGDNCLRDDYLSLKQSMLLTFLRCPEVEDSCDGRSRAG